MRESKRLHWHIDYLLGIARLKRDIWAQSPGKVECRLARFFASHFPCVPHFGASDCRCRSHLFWNQGKEELLRAARAAFLTCGLVPELIGRQLAVEILLRSEMHVKRNHLDLKFFDQPLWQVTRTVSDDLYGLNHNSPPWMVC